MQQFQLKNARGDQLQVLSYGATLQHWSARLGSQQRELILSYPKAEHYRKDCCYVGAVAGPYANRIGQSSFKLEQQRYQLEANEGQHHLHGGSQGLHCQHWQLKTQYQDAVELVCSRPDGLGGYPGPVHFSLLYQLTADGALAATFQARAERVTLVGPTLHPYFNLAAVPEGGAKASIDAHQLQLKAAHYAVVDHECIPTGELAKVQGTAFDFQQRRLLAGAVLDHNFVVAGDVRQASAELTSPDGQLKLQVSSDYPGLQVYTGEHLAAPFQARQGICLEPQFFPDSPNQPCFPFHYTRPEQPFRAHIRYQLER
ncbi:aldose epimerase family protein [Rheinheimera sp.]|uniref:aldose epimerase family protein n=1 Tax=Rheinheimera sp. TaxID=1869214 RepID=UPI00307FC32C